MSNAKTALLAPRNWGATAGLGSPAAAQQKEVADRHAMRTAPAQRRFNRRRAVPGDARLYYDLINAGGAGSRAIRFKADEIEQRIQGPAGRRGLSAP